MDARLMIGSGIRQVIGNPQINGNQQSKVSNNQNGFSFEELFQKAIKPQSEESFHISAHAQKRLSERSIEMSGNLENTLNEAFSELEAKGSKNSLVITGQGAFVVNVPNRTLVTAMDINEMKDGIVTNIDSVNMKLT